MRRRALVAYAVTAAPLAAGALPLYIHAPDFYAAERGVGLAALGATLAWLRLLDAGFDPLAGWAGDRFPQARGALMAAGAALLAAGVVALFAPPAGVAPLAWFALAMALASLGHSLLGVNLVTLGGLWGGDRAARARVAGWREGFGLVGLIVAVSLPAALAPWLGRGGALLALGLATAAGLALAVPGLLRWRRRTRLAAPEVVAGGGRWRPLLPFYLAAGLVLLSAAFPAVLILMLVRDLLGAEALGGAFLLAYFLAALPGAALAARLAARHGAARVWTAALALSIPAFAGALTLGPGDGLAFLAVCVATGLLFGADLVLPPAILAARLAETGATGLATRAHGVLALLGKLALALAGAVALPALGAAGFAPGGTNDAEALGLLRTLYAGLPLALRAVAVAVLVGAMRRGGV